MCVCRTLFVKSLSVIEHLVGFIIYSIGLLIAKVQSCPFCPLSAAFILHTVLQIQVPLTRNGGGLYVSSLVLEALISLSSFDLSSSLVYHGFP